MFTKPFGARASTTDMACSGLAVTASHDHRPARQEGLPPHAAAHVDAVPDGAPLARVQLRAGPSVSGDPCLPLSWTFGISGAPGALFLRILAMPRRGPPEVIRRRPGAARQAPPAVRLWGHRGGRAAPPDPGTMGRRRAAWTGRGSPPTPASRPPPPP